MNGCYIDCPNMVDFPFTAKDFFTDRDIALINGEVEGEVIDNNFFSALSASGAPGNLIQSDKLKWRTNDYGVAPAGSFNANGILSDIELKRAVWEWLTNTFHEDYIQHIWDFNGNHVPPVTVLCFSLDSGWHSEGPILHKGLTQPHFDNRARPPAVLNFRLLGDADNSYIEFAEPSEKMAQAEKEIVELFIEKTKTEPNIPFITHKDLNISKTVQGFYNDVWTKELKLIGTHHGMHNPYFVNVSKWHRVITNNTPRVTLRVHANTKLTFEEIERLVNSGEFFKVNTQGWTHHE